MHRIQTIHQRPIAPQPFAFFAANSEFRILDFSTLSNSPESRVSLTLRSTHLHQNVVKLVGVGGAGKTTILHALGRDRYIWETFPDGVWLLQLSRDTTIRTLLQNFLELLQFVFPNFLQNSPRLTTTERLRKKIISVLADDLAAKRILIMFDDFWDIHKDVHDFVKDICSAVQMINCHNKVLISTRGSELIPVLNHDVSVDVNPVSPDSDTARQIFCFHANIDISNLPLLSTENQLAFLRIIDICAGLPLALRIAGSAVLSLRDENTNTFKQDTFVRYLDQLERAITNCSQRESGESNSVFATLQASLEILENTWNCETISASSMFRSLCILQEQCSIPLSVIGKLWGVSGQIVLKGVLILIRNSIVSEVTHKRDGVLGLRVHGLVHELSMDMAKIEEGGRFWHKRLLDGYRSSSRAPEEGDNSPVPAAVQWWSPNIIDDYIIDNLVRHLLADHRDAEALRLLTDYRWIEAVNKDQRREAFNKIISDMQLLTSYLDNQENSEETKSIVSDIGLVVKVMEQCMIPYCAKNREECTFQLHGRLTALSSSSRLVKRILWSIEKYGSVPWARAGPGVLEGAQGGLNRVLEMEKEASYTSMTTTRQGLVVGGVDGSLSIVSSRDGSTLCSLVGHRKEIVDIHGDEMSGKIYSCDRDGIVIVWKNGKELKRFKAQELESHRQVVCMQVLGAKNEVVIGTTEGRLIVLDTESGRTCTSMHGHSISISAMVAGRNGDVLVSSSDNNSIRAWKRNNSRLDALMLVDGKSATRCLALSADEQLVASGSLDGVVRLWDISICRQVWNSSDEHEEVINCVTFSANGEILYSGDESGKVCRWNVRSGGSEVTLSCTLRRSIDHVKRLFVSAGNSELYGLGGHLRNYIYVWDTKSIWKEGQIEDVLLSDVKSFGLSADAATLVTCNWRKKCIEVQNVCDVVHRKQETIWRHHVAEAFQNRTWDTQYDKYSSFRRRPGDFGKLISMRNYIRYRKLCRWRIILAVSNDQSLVAYTCPADKVVHLIDMRNGKERTLISERQSHTKKRFSSWSRMELHFNPDATVITFFTSRSRSTSTSAGRNISWLVSTGEKLQKSLQASQTTAAPQTISSSISTTGNSTQRLSCNPYGLHDSSDSVSFVDESFSFVIASLDIRTYSTLYCPQMSRLWVSRIHGGLTYIDLIQPQSDLDPGEEPPLPVLSSSHSESLAMQTIPSNS